MKIYDVLEYLLENQGSGGDSNVEWVPYPVYNYASNELLPATFSPDRSVELATLWIPCDKDTHQCSYSTWKDLIADTQEVNDLFHYDDQNDIISFGGLVDLVNIHEGEETPIALGAVFLDMEDTSNNRMSPVIPDDYISDALPELQGGSLNFVLLPVGGNGGGGELE